MMKLLRTCRAVLRELKAASEAGEARGGDQWRYIASAVRRSRPQRHRPTAESQEGGADTLISYLAYLQSSRRHRELLEQYQGKGERSIEESAKLVGLKLPGNATESEPSDLNDRINNTQM